MSVIYAFDAIGKLFHFNPKSSDVKKWERNLIQKQVGDFDDLYLYRGQWFNYVGNVFDEITSPGKVLPRARHFTDEQARDWFIASHQDIPDELARLRPGAEPTPLSDVVKGPQLPESFSYAEMIRERIASGRKKRQETTGTGSVHVAPVTPVAAASPNRRNPYAERDRWLAVQPGSGSAIKKELDRKIISTEGLWKPLSVPRINAIRKEYRDRAAALGITVEDLVASEREQK